MKRRSIFLLCFIMIAVSLSSCLIHHDSEEIKRVAGHYGYESKLVNLPQIEDHQQFIDSILWDETNYIISASYFSIINYEYLTRIYTVNEEGNIIHTLEMPDRQSPEAIINGKYAFISTTNEVVLYDNASSTLIDSIPLESQGIGIVGGENSFIVVENDRIDQFSFDNQLLSTIQIDLEISYDYPCFFDNGKFYAIGVLPNGIGYYELDFNRRTYTYKMGSADLGVHYLGCKGQYVFERGGEYYINIEEMLYTTLADWNEIDIRPASKALYSSEEYCPINNSRFVKYYEYLDGTTEILLFKYSSKLDYSKIDSIVVGGYGIQTDTLVLWAQYIYNTTHSDSRVILDDYNDEITGQTSEEIHSDLLELIKYFNEGNAPDIYYGTYFDYEYWGRNGMVIDLRSYLEESPELLSSMNENIKELILSGNSCYQLFGGYYLNGFFSYSDIIGSPDISISQLDALSIENDTAPFSPRMSINVAEQAILYSFDRLFHEGRSEYDIINDLEEILNFSFEYGVSDFSMVRLDGLDSVSNGTNILSLNMMGYSTLLNMSYDEINSLNYAGYPSTYGSAHVLNPCGGMAISSDSPSPDLCFDFIKMIYSEEAQRSVLYTGGIPVVDSVITDFNII